MADEKRKEVDLKEQLRAGRIIRRFDKIKGERGTLDSHLQEVAEWVVPRKSYVTVKRQEGTKTITMNTEMFEPTAVFANQFMAAGLVSHLAPPNQKWFALKARDQELNESPAVKESLARITTILHEELAVSNFNLQINELCLDLGWAGMGCMEPKEGKETALSFKNHHVSEFVIAENSDGLVDTVLYKFEYTARQAAQEWGKERLGKNVLDALTSEKPEDGDKKFWFIQEIKPREDHDRFPARADRRPISEVFVGVKDKNIIAESGYYEMPKLTPRWSKNSNEVNGRSQGMFALPWIKRLNTTSKDLTQARQMRLRPTTLTPDDGFIGPVRSVPGAIWHYRASYAANPNAIRQFPVVGDTNDGSKEIERLEMNIKKAFFNDLFVWLSEQKTGRKTAFEIAQRMEEKHTMIVPPIGRLQSELFNGLISRCIGILGRAGKFRGVIAPELIGQQYEIQYISKLALALRAIETRAVVQTFEVVGPLAEQFPLIFDNYDGDEIARGVGERMGMPPSMIRSPEKRDEIREVRIAQEQAQQQAEALAEAAKAVPGLGKAVEDGSPLEALAGVI